jgi:hypothetical protein
MKRPTEIWTRYDDGSMDHCHFDKPRNRILITAGRCERFCRFCSNYLRLPQKWVDNWRSKISTLCKSLSLGVYRLPPSTRGRLG